MPEPFLIFSNTRLMVILASLIGLRLIMQYFTIPIPQFSMSISVSWVPLMVVGWFFGPLMGFMTGAVTDTLSYLIKPTSQWFWLYAIQEPLVGLVSGFVGYLAIKNFTNKSGLISVQESLKQKFLSFDFVLFQTIMLIFVGLFLYIMIGWVNLDQPFAGVSSFTDAFLTSYKWILLSVVLFFFFAIEGFMVSFIVKNKKKSINNFCYIGILVLACTFIFSFILGPISAVEYFKFINGREPNSFVKYGSIFYLIPRVIKESFKAPVQIFLLTLILPIVDFNIKKQKQQVSLKW